MRVQRGDLVKVRAYGGEILTRRLVEVQGKTAIITTDEEREAAAKEKREIICVGFPLADVISVVAKSQEKT